MTATVKVSASPKRDHAALALSPLGKSAGRRILIGLGPQYSGRAFGSLDRLPWDLKTEEGDLIRFLAWPAQETRCWNEMWGRVVVRAPLERRQDA
jgi:hypothetical protein